MKAPRLMIGLPIPRHMESLGDGCPVVEQPRTLYRQAFRGMAHFQWKVPCDPSLISRLRRRIGDEGCGRIFELSARMLRPEDPGEVRAFADAVVIDSTVREKVIACPPDSRLRVKVIEYALRIGKPLGVRSRQTYSQKIRKLNRIIRFSCGRKAGQAAKATRTLRTYAGRVLRNLEAGPTGGSAPATPDSPPTPARASGREGDTDGGHGISEPQVVRITRGGSGKKHERICMDRRACAIVGAVSFTGNPHDSTILDATLRNIGKMTGGEARHGVLRRGIQGKDGGERHADRAPEGTGHIGFGQSKETARRDLGRRSAIEPVTGHPGNDHRMLRNFPRGALGDSVDLLLAVAAFNFRKCPRGMGAPCLFFVPEAPFSILVAFLPSGRLLRCPSHA